MNQADRTYYATLDLSCVHYTSSILFFSPSGPTALLHLSTASLVTSVNMFSRQLTPLVLFALLSLAMGQSVNFTDCGEGNVKDVRIFPCSGSNPCVIKLGTNVTVEADFVAPFSTNKLYEVIKGVIRGREMPFPEQRADPCNSGNIYPSCPVKQGENYQFKAWFEVKPFYPPISIKVKYSLTDPTGQKIACVQVSAKIVDPNPKSSQRNRKRNKTNKQKN